MGEPPRGLLRPVPFPPKKKASTMAGFLFGMGLEGLDASHLFEVVAAQRSSCASVFARCATPGQVAGNEPPRGLLRPVPSSQIKSQHNG